MRKIFLTIMLLFSLTMAMAEGGGERPMVGAERLSDYSHLLEGRRVGVVANYASRVGHTHLIDTLLTCGVDVKIIFTPSEGFREGGERVVGRDSYLGIPIKSLLAAPKANDVFGCDVVIYDVVDSGIRCSSALAALWQMMVVCADVGVPFVVLDRPNPMGSCVDGAIPEGRYSASGEMLPLPLLYGMTLGEMARMIDGEGWLADGRRCAPIVIPYTGYCPEQIEQPSAILSRGLCEELPITDEGGAIDLSAVVAAYVASETKEEFFDGEIFGRMLGVGYVRDMIEQEYGAEEIEAMWSSDVERFKIQREPYLIYK